MNKIDPNATNTQISTPRKRVRPLVALRAVRALIADKENTAQVFTIIDALAGGNDARVFRRFFESETGARIIAERCELIDVLSDMETLRSLPEGSLGRRYHAFMADQNLSADGLVEASDLQTRRMNYEGDALLFKNRMRDSHDLWHVVTGYGRDGLGELSLLAFTYAQTRNRGIGLIVLFGLRAASKDYPKAGIWRALREGYRLGRAAKWLPGADWERLLPLPLSQVRHELAIVTQNIYPGILARIREMDARRDSEAGFKLA
jgi:ubiquinone biosynthesis protein COQ4